VAERLPPLFESGTFGCPACGSPEVEFLDFKTHGRTFAVAGRCYGLGEATAYHRWVVEMTMTPGGVTVKVAPLHEDVHFAPSNVKYNGLPLAALAKPNPYDPLMMTKAELEEALRLVLEPESKLARELTASVLMLGEKPHKVETKGKKFETNP
jgi:hypothetical protein